MANRIKLLDFLTIWSIKIGKNTSPETMRKYLDALNNLILEQLKLNGELYIYNLGSFTLDVPVPDTKPRLIGDPNNGGARYMICNPRPKVRFKPSNVLIEAIENDFEYRKKPSKRKYKRLEYIEIRNERRRKEKPTMADILCEMTNEIEETRKNG